VLPRGEVIIAAKGGKRHYDLSLAQVGGKDLAVRPPARKGEGRKEAPTGRGEDLAPGAVLQFRENSQKEKGGSRKNGGEKGEKYPH